MFQATPLAMEVHIRGSDTPVAGNLAWRESAHVAEASACSCRFCLGLIENSVRKWLQAHGAQPCASLVFG